MATYQVGRTKTASVLANKTFQHHNRVTNHWGTYTGVLMAYTLTMGIPCLVCQTQAKHLGYPT
jgi:hypothetical protein